jgi:hypothetical protein
MLSLSAGCSLNNVDSNIGPKPSLISDDVDFNWDLWPELEENQPLQQQKIEVWPEIKNKTILYLGDESLQGNWGLLIQRAFLKSGHQPWFLSTCMTAREFKNGGTSSCGYWSQPFQQDYVSATYLTLDQTADSDRLAPKIISDEKVNTVVISFGHRISVMESLMDIQQELSAIELLAKWAHSSGKKCYVVEPRDRLYVETDKNDFLTEVETNRLKRAVSYYCDWIEAVRLKNDYLDETQIPLDSILESTRQDDSQGFVPSPVPGLNINTTQPRMDFEGIEIPKNNIIPSETVLPETESIEDKIARLRQLENQEEQAPVDDSDLQPGGTDQVQSPSPVPLIRPRARPERITVAAQQAVRQQLEEPSAQVSPAVVRQQSALVPQFLWNGHNNGSALTDIGRKYLNSRVASHLLETRNLRDIENFCPNYWNLNKDNRENFWIFLYSAVARFENDSFNPRALHREQSSGRHSIGIFQVDTVNCGYGADSNRARLFDLDNNFKCALTRGTALVRSGRQVADGRYVNRRYSDFGMDGYWSVLRRPYQGAAMNSRTGQYQNVSLGRRSQIINMTKAIRICQ